MKNRASGILLHITSLPSPFGMGDLGPWAYRFADFLAQGSQTYWQVLPVTPTDQGSGNSPYSSPSAFAGNPLLVSPERLIETGFLTREETGEIPPFPAERCDFPAAIPYKEKLLGRAFERFRNTGKERAGYETFCDLNSGWLDDFALFRVIKRLHDARAWGTWENGLRDREPRALMRIRNDFPEALEREKFLQFLFFTQWTDLKRYCNDKGLNLIGDIPIYVNYDSADVWTRTDLFKLNEGKRPTGVAGVPPDYFSKTGQLWGNPIYRWDVLQKTGYQWWVERIDHSLHLFDLLRIDHFRGFVGYWEVPAGETTAISGAWQKAPADDFFTVLLENIPGDSLIAEDLGFITEDVKEVMNRFGFPGMKILQFAFGEDLATHPFLPHNYIPNCIAYTGTHDNNTIRGWFENEATSEEKRNLTRYLGREVRSQDLAGELIRLLMMSIARTVITPLQDILGLDEDARMNRPSTSDGNWGWRFLPEQLSPDRSDWLREVTSIYGRAL